MKAFKKWFESHWDSNYQGPMRGDMEESWREALKEVLMQLNNIYDGDFENSEIVKWINKELGEEDETQKV